MKRVIISIWQLSVQPDPQIHVKSSWEKKTQPHIPHILAKEDIPMLLKVIHFSQRKILSQILYTLPFTYGSLHLCSRVNWLNLNLPAKEKKILT